MPPWYELVKAARRDEIVYHYDSNQMAFIGRSTVDREAEYRLLDDEPSYVVRLKDFEPLSSAVSLASVRTHADDIYTIRDELNTRYQSILYLPFQFKKDRSQLAPMSNYCAKLPSEMARLLFENGSTSGDTGTRVAPAESPRTTARTTRPIFGLLPFKEKRDGEYIANVAGGSQIRSRDHELLVNRYAEWLAEHGYAPVYTRQ
jgi:hypothetical protein